MCVIFKSGWVVWCTEEEYEHKGPEDGRLVQASTAQQAAEIWVECEDDEGFYSSDYGENSIVVHVMPKDSGDVYTFSVRGKRTVNYYAEEMKVEVNDE